MATQEHNESTTAGLLGRRADYVEAPGDRICRLAAHLDALLNSWIGDGFEAFSGWNSDIQHELLSVASSLATDLHKTISLPTHPAEENHG